MKLSMSLFVLAFFASALVAGVAEANPPCGTDKAWAAECKELRKLSDTMCEPERIRTNSPKGVAQWMSGVRDAAAFEARLKAFADKHPHCLTEPVSKVCAINKSMLDACSGLPKKFADAWPTKVDYERKEVMRHLPGLEKRAAADPKEVWDYYRNAKRYLTKVFSAVLSIDPANKEFSDFQARLKAVGKTVVAANLDAIGKVKCPKGRKPNAKLEKALMKAYTGFLGGLSTKMKARKVGLDTAVVKETDMTGTKWEYANTVTCVEELADPKDPARCSVQEVSFKRSKPPGKSWSAWSFRAHGARDDAMLCKNIK